MANGNPSAYANVNFTPEPINKLASAQMSRVASIMREDKAIKRQEAIAASQAYKSELSKVQSKLMEYSKNAGDVIAEVDENAYANTVNMRDYYVNQAEQYISKGDFTNAYKSMMRMDRDMSSMNSISDTFKSNFESIGKKEISDVNYNKLGVGNVMLRLNDMRRAEWTPDGFLLKGEDGTTQTVGFDYFEYKPDFKELDPEWQSKILDYAKSLVGNFATEEVSRQIKNEDGTVTTKTDKYVKNENISKSVGEIQGLIEDMIRGDMVLYEQIAEDPRIKDDLEISTFARKYAEIAVDTKVLKGQYSEKIEIDKKSDKGGLTDRETANVDAISKNIDKFYSGAQDVGKTFSTDAVQVIDGNTVKVTKTRLIRMPDGSERVQIIGKDKDGVEFQEKFDKNTTETNNRLSLAYYGTTASPSIRAGVDDNLNKKTYSSERSADQYEWVVDDAIKNAAYFNEIKPVDVDNLIKNIKDFGLKVTRDSRFMGFGKSNVRFIIGEGDNTKLIDVSTMSTPDGYSKAKSDIINTIYSFHPDRTQKGIVFTWDDNQNKYVEKQP